MVYLKYMLIALKLEFGNFMPFVFFYKTGMQHLNLFLKYKIGLPSQIVFAFGRYITTPFTKCGVLISICNFTLNA
jgi:hypothetical protein